MKKTTAAFAVLLLILTGCSFQPGEYPRVSPVPLPVVQPVTIGITIPQNADEAVETAVIVLQAKLGELSGGAVTSEVYRSADVSYDLQLGDAGLYLLNDSQAVALDSRLAFIQMPYLFESSDQLLTILNSAGGEVRGSSVTRERLGGEIIGVYYGGTSWFMGRGKFYDEVGFYKSVGVLAGLPGNACFGHLGAETVTEGSRAELFELFAQEQIKYCELRPDDPIPEDAMSKVKGLDVTDHRFGSGWMILSDRDSTLEPMVRSIIKEAFAYTIVQHDNTRRDLDVARMSRMEEALGIVVPTDADYLLTWHTARRYYRERWEALGIPRAIWSEIQLLMGY